MPEHWISTESGSHLLIDGDGGEYTIVGGVGGKLNGTKVSPTKMLAPRTKRLPVPQGHHRLSNPAKIVKETDKAYGISNPDYEEAKREYEWGGNEAVAKRVSSAGIEAWRERRSLNWLPKSHTTQHEGHIVTASEWLARKLGMPTIERQENREAAFKAGQERYSNLVAQAKAAGVPGIRDKMKTSTIKQKMRDHGLAVDDSAADDEIDWDIDRESSRPGMTRAAGIMFLTPDGETLLLKRGAGGDWPGAWCFPGGHCDGGESFEEAAKREAVEELGFLPDGDMAVWTRRQSANQAPIPADAVNPVPPLGEYVDYTTFIQRVPERFDPKLNGEHTAFAWCKIETPPEPLHPGVSISLRRFGMTETDIAEAIRYGELTSPQWFGNLALFAMRITGTGIAYRSKLDEYVYRDPALYIDPGFLKRCNGLPVVWEHPKDRGKLDTEEFANRVIGAVCLPYFKGEEIWGIARIYDEDAARRMESEQLSTSPGVVFRPTDGNVSMAMEDGSAFLVEGRPSLIDHLAICEEGVWDKEGPPVGVQIPETPTSTEAAMAETEEKRAAEEKDDARKDADMGAALRSIMDRLDSMEKRMDRKRHDDDDDESRRDRAHRKDDDDDAKRKDARHRKDEDDDRRDRKARKDEDEDKDLDPDGHEETAADKRRKDAKRKDEDDRRKDEDDDRRDRRARKDDDDEDDGKRKDAHRRDEDIDKRDARRRHDDDEDDRRNSTAKELAALKRQIAAMPRYDADDAEFGKAQERADSVYSAHGQKAKAPMQGESVIGYRRRLAAGLQKHSKAWAGIDLAKLDGDALAVAETQIYNDSVKAADDFSTVPAGQLIARRSRDDAGRTITEFKGTDFRAGFGAFMSVPKSVRITPPSNR